MTNPQPYSPVRSQERELALVAQYKSLGIRQVLAALQPQPQRQLPADIESRPQG